jgi:hypothetical protein
MQLSKHTKLQRVENAVAAGTTAVESDVVDVAGYEGVMFVIALGAIVSGAVTSAKAQQGAASDLSDAADLLGTSVTIADTDDNKLVYLDVNQPRERYVRCLVSRATQNATVDGITAILYGARVVPTTHDSATVAGGEAHVAVAEGTA